MELKSLTLNGEKYDSFAAPGDALLLDRNLVAALSSGSKNVEIEDGNVVLTYNTLNTSGYPMEAYFTITASEALTEGESYVLSFNCTGVPADKDGKSFEFKITRGNDKTFTLQNGHNTISFIKTGTNNSSIFIDDTALNATRPTQELVGDGVVLSDFMIYPAEHVTVGETALLRSVTPTLSYQQRTAMKALMDAYYNNRKVFGYNYDATRNWYANERCWNSTYSRFNLCCATFVEAIWMGRSVNDFVDKTGDTYSNTITKAFDWGYYFDYHDRARIAGVVKSNSVDEDGNPVTEYYKYRQPLGTDEYSYSVNTNYNVERVGDSNYSNAQGFKGFLMAHDMAKELYRMGCEIPFSELMVGDIVFLGDPWDTPVNDHLFRQATRFRGISHVALVYDILEDGTIRWMDCTSDAFVWGSETYQNPILLCHAAQSTMFDLARGICTVDSIVMCARHPAAWGKGNMADRETVDFMTMAATDGLTNDRAIPLDFSNGSVTVEAGKWYTCDNHVGKAATSATVSAWDEIAFTTLYT